MRQLLSYEVIILWISHHKPDICSGDVHLVLVHFDAVQMVIPGQRFDRSK